MSRNKKRFVAGARCPGCQALDSVYLYQDNGVETVACTECDYHEQQVDKPVAEQASGEVIGIFRQ
ncbi:DNA-binding protein [Shewanella sp. NFH-SH190041]|uniref:YheV family putative zinc ribbon protein n=1 Tax=Shewanella sp. NFH-SH190041 TaxID=2950245 RepID=UPI0021C289CB|nr:YheV family putative zinc ribbon protein [Shewanella sp. NFH-SH190041]BDM65724.1 DNA-binding protein [Shewanella sp. NFH-SH190041]